MNLSLLEHMSGVTRAVPLAPLATFQVGGAADYFVSAESENQLLEALRAGRQSGVPVYLLAGCSNIVFADGVIPGFFIRIGYGAVRAEASRLFADAGADLAALIETSFVHSLSGLESLSGIPGTVGGAIVGNAGAYGRSISEKLVSVRVFDGESVQELSREECAFRYRNSRFKDDRTLVVLSAQFELEPGDEKALRERSKDIIKKRALTYNPALRCPGSFFKNVLLEDVPHESLSLIDQRKIIDGKVPVGWLLEQVGSKGMRQGGIEIAQTHGNLLVNTGGAAYEDVRTLAGLLKQKVQEKFGISIEEEIRYIG